MTQTMARHRLVLRPESYLCSDLLGVVFAVAVTVGGAAHPVFARDHDACERFREPNLIAACRNSPGRTLTQIRAVERHIR